MFRILLALFFINLSFGQQINNVDFIKCDALININFKNKLTYGGVIYDFKVLKKTDTIYVDAKNMNIDFVFVNGKKVEFDYSEEKIKIFSNFKIGKINYKYLIPQNRNKHFILQVKMKIYKFGHKDKVVTLVIGYPVLMM